MDCASGLLGCRWGNALKPASSKCNGLWFALICTASIYTGFWFYVWTIADNNIDIDEYLWEVTGYTFPLYLTLWLLTGGTLIYVVLLLLLYLYHIGRKLQPYLSVLHRVVLLLIVVTCAVLTWLITWLSKVQWLFVKVSILFTVPFLHVIVVVLMTVIGCFVIIHGARIKHTCRRYVWFVMFSLVMVVVYVFPVFVHSPCIGTGDTLPDQPKLVSHRGASSVYPENTEMAFERAASYPKVITLESDVSVSFDGVPFVFHDDRTLTRTTNVEVVFPQLAHLAPCMFNMSQLQQLDAGSWFLQRDPFGSVNDLTDEEKDEVRSQKIPSLASYLAIAKKYNKNVMFDMRFGCRDGTHPFSDNDAWIGEIINTILESGIPPKQVWWIQEDGDDVPDYPFTLVSNNPHSPENLKQKGYSVLNVRPGTVDLNQHRDYEENNINVNTYIINTRWMFSIYWCMGGSSVTTDIPSIADLQSPIWRLSQGSFTALWISVDLLSIVCFYIVGFKIWYKRRRKREGSVQYLASGSGQPTHSTFQVPQSSPGRLIYPGSMQTQVAVAPGTSFLPTSTIAFSPREPSVVVAGIQTRHSGWDSTPSFWPGFKPIVLARVHDSCSGQDLNPSFWPNQNETLMIM